MTDSTEMNELIARPVATAHAETVLVTGASQGIGLEFVCQYAARNCSVIATHRRSTAPEELVKLRNRYPKVSIEQMDVTDHNQIEALGAKLRGIPIDIIINNAALVRSAMFIDRAGNADQVLGTLDYKLFDDFMHTNVTGPLRIAEVLGPNLKASNVKKFITISSAAGSVSIIPRTADHYWYRISKAAVNMAMRVLAVDFQKDQAIVAFFHPGGVRTKSLRTANMPSLESADIAVAKLIKVIDGLTMKDSGRFLQPDGKDQPW